MLFIVVGIATLGALTRVLNVESMQVRCKAVMSRQHLDYVDGNLTKHVGVPFDHIGNKPRQTIS